MNRYSLPMIFRQLQAEGCLRDNQIIHTQDGFYVAYQSLAEMLAEKGILDFPDSQGIRLSCSNFFDDWFLYAVPENEDYIYSLLKFREQEHDLAQNAPADGDTPGVTVCFISFACQILLECLQNPSDANRQKLNREINRVVAHRGQHHHGALKRYFANPGSEGAYLAASLYIKHIAAFSQNGSLAVPDQYRALVQKHASSGKDARIPAFIASINREAGRTVCDGKHIYIKDREHPDRYESAAVLATHTGNTSLYSFTAEVEYHARFLTPMAKIKIPFFGRSAYDSAIRADMSIADTEFQGPTPFYRAESRIVKRQYALHHEKQMTEKTES